MINYVWMGMILLGIICAFMQGNIERVTQAALESAQSSVQLCFGLIGVYALWLGLLRVAEKAGLVAALSRKMQPLIRFLFPDISSHGNALGSITMNLTANMLGLGNAATPLGLKAMKELQQLNRDKNTASNAMCMFLVVNSCSIQLIPTTVIALRSSAGSVIPVETIGTTLVATFCAVFVGILSAKLLQHYF